MPNYSFCAVNRRLEPASVQLHDTCLAHLEFGLVPIEHPQSSHAHFYRSSSCPFAPLSPPSQPSIRWLMRRYVVPVLRGVANNRPVSWPAGTGPEELLAFGDRRQILATQCLRNPLEIGLLHHFATAPPPVTRRLYFARHFLGTLVPYGSFILSFG